MLSILDPYQLRIGALRRGPAGPAPAPQIPVVIDGLTTNAFHSAFAQSASTLTAQTGESVDSYAWQVDGADIAGASAPSYTVVIGQDGVSDLSLLRLRVTKDGVDSYSLYTVVRHAPPTALGLAPVVSTQGDGTPIVNLAAGFSGQSLNYTSDQPWATVAGSNLTIADEERMGTVLVTAENSGGSVSTALTVTISEPNVLLVSPIGDQSFAQDEGDVTLDLRFVFANATTYGVSGPGAVLDGDGYTLRLADDVPRAGALITVTGSNTNSSATDVFTLTVVAPTVTAALSVAAIGPQQAGGDVPVDYSIDLDDSAVAVLLLRASTADPGPGAFGATSGGGADAGGYTDLGTVALSTGGGTVALAVPDDLNATYKLAFLTAGSTTPVVSGPVSIDTMPVVAPLTAGITVGTSTKVIEEDVFLNANYNASSPSVWQAAAGTNRLVIATVLFGTPSGVPDTVTVTVGAQAMTQIGNLGTMGPSRPKTAMFYLLDADIPSGAETVSVSINNGCRDCSVVMTELAGVNQSSPIGDAVEFSSTAPNGPADETITVEYADSFILSALQTHSTNGAIAINCSTDSGGTLSRIPAGDVTDTNVFAGALFYEIAASTGNITHTWTMNPTAKKAMRMIEIREA
ncbi:MAG: hypothetical protein AAGB07_07075 [Pseudomonadota bacterium]